MQYGHCLIILEISVVALFVNCVVKIMMVVITHTGYGWCTLVFHGVRVSFAVWPLSYYTENSCCCTLCELRGQIMMVVVIILLIAVAALLVYRDIKL